VEHLVDALGSEGVRMVSFFLTGGAIAVAIVAVVQWRMVRIAELEANLKREMIQRGMSAEEIVHVLSGKPPIVPHTKRSADRPVKETADFVG
jgi:hypothetical protein